jgi:hypothetical protein
MWRPCDIACGQGCRGCRNFSDLSHEGLSSIVRQTIDMEWMLVMLLAVLWWNNVWGVAA